MPAAASGKTRPRHTRRNAADIKHVEHDLIVREKSLQLFIAPKSPLHPEIGLADRVIEIPIEMDRGMFAFENRALQQRRRRKAGLRPRFSTKIAYDHTEVRCT